MTKFYEIKYARSERPMQSYNPGTAFASTDVSKLVGLSSGYVSLLSTASTGVLEYTYEEYGILRGIPDGTCTAKSTQRCFVTPIDRGDVLRCIVSSNISTSGTPAASSDIGKVLGLKGNGPQFPNLSTAGTMLTQGPLRGIVVGVPSTGYVDVKVQNINLVKMTTA